MMLPRPIVLLGSLSLLVGWGACTRSTLDAVTRMPGTGGSNSDSRDTPVDSSPDTGPDTAPDTARDTALEALRDTGPEAGPEPGPEAGPEPGPEAGPEPGPEAGPEPGPEAGPEPGSDTSTDIDTGSDARSDTATCPSSVLATGDINQTVQVGTSTRTYLLHVPSTYKGSKPVPLVVDFHGISTSGSAEKMSSPYPAQTDQDGAIMAFPDGARGPMGSAWNVGPCCVKDVDDVAFAKAVVQQVQGMACIDAKRVYAVGFSMGGGMAYYLACHAADVFAAIAPSAFDLMEEQLADCRPARPITVISFRGTGDTLVPYSGGYSNVVPGMPVNFLGAKKTFQKWAELDECTDSPSAEDSNGCSSYTNCQGGVEVILCSKPGGQEYVNANVAWPVLKRHTR
jgi:polyhydroxybutyrate depolymerase